MGFYFIRGSMKQILVGMAFIAFGIIIGGVGIATAGIGIGIPMIPIGIYLVIRGFHSLKKKKKIINDEVSEINSSNNDAMSRNKNGGKPFEFTRLGNILFGLLLNIIRIPIIFQAPIIGLIVVVFGFIFLSSGIKRFF